MVRWHLTLISNFFCRREESQRTQRHVHRDFRKGRLQRQTAVPAGGGRPPRHGVVRRRCRRWSGRWWRRRRKVRHDWSQTERWENPRETDGVGLYLLVTSSSHLSTFPGNSRGLSSYSPNICACLGLHFHRLPVPRGVRPLCASAKRKVILNNLTQNLTQGNGVSSDGCVCYYSTFLQSFSEKWVTFPLFSSAFHISQQILCHTIYDKFLEVQWLTFLTAKSIKTWFEWPKTLLLECFWAASLKKGHMWLFYKSVVQKIQSSTL